MSYETELDALKTYIDSVKIPEPKSGRKIAKISDSELVEKFKDWIYNSHKNEFDDVDSVELYDVAKNAQYTGKVKSDLEKIEFDSENAECENICHLDGYSVAHCWAGGDWEYPVHFFLYFDGTDIRGYIPENGNTFNYFCKSAFGSENGEGCRVMPIHSGLEKKIDTFVKNIGGWDSIPDNDLEDCSEDSIIHYFARNCEYYRRGYDVNFSQVQYGQDFQDNLAEDLDTMLNDFAKRVGIR